MCGRLGFSIDAACEGQGLMREALSAVVDFAFGELGLHRIEANHQPQNLRSAALLRSLGFDVQGYARDYLFLNGAWRDHVLTARTAPQG
jgi:ribosomal-protein-alanine N-acetyltransferase